MEHCRSLYMNLLSYYLHERIITGPLSSSLVEYWPWDCLFAPVILKSHVYHFLGCVEQTRRAITHVTPRAWQLSLQTGKAAGFLALDWCDGSATEALTRRSYELHRHLANEFGAERIGYRTVKTISGSLLPNTQGKSGDFAGRGSSTVSSKSRYY